MRKCSTIICILFLLLSFSCSQEYKHTPIIPNPTQKEEQVRDSSLTKPIIGITEYGYFDPALRHLVINQIKEFYGLTTVYNTRKPLPIKAYVEDRDRYYAGTLLFYLKRAKPDSIDYHVGLTEADICTTTEKSETWGIFGLGSLSGHSCIISTYRLKRDASRIRLEERLIKVVLHELGHNFGLDHCSTKGCLMEDAEGKLLTVDLENLALCRHCTEKLGALNDWY